MLKNAIFYDAQNKKADLESNCDISGVGVRRRDWYLEIIMTDG